MNHITHEINCGVSSRDECLIDRREVCRRTSMSKTTLYRKIREGTFPPASHRDGPKWVRWRLTDVLAWIENNQS
ncbi:helix-turn-helix transcriptional regulator [Acetobacter aceti]